MKKFNRRLIEILIEMNNHLVQPDQLKHVAFQKLHKLYLVKPFWRELYIIVKCRLSLYKMLNINRIVQYKEELKETHQDKRNLNQNYKRKNKESRLYCKRKRKLMIRFRNKDKLEKIKNYHKRLELQLFNSLNKEISQNNYHLQEAV